MRPYILPLLAVLAAGLAACQTLTPEERRARDEQTCTGYGFKRGTDGFATCLQRIELDRRAQARYDSDWVMADMAYNLNGPNYYPRYYRYRH
ncbi:hypothetical protein FHX06_004567 [Rhizobium sp. BK512]|uniref:hypothetical protein n=1 Tax=Rhizobium sp. BK512 TaxID=2587010 RepID=UPI000DDE4FF9|nr:hypothetical protein [Rhizobium sp. BK512]MBB3563223.1 hypothetical protein [Rhizobium sp. BK512]